MRAVILVLLAAGGLANVAAEAKYVPGSTNPIAGTHTPPYNQPEPRRFNQPAPPPCANPGFRCAPDGSGLRQPSLRGTAAPAVRPGYGTGILGPAGQAPLPGGP
jgi:hypothetical protein